MLTFEVIMKIRELIGHAYNGFIQSVQDLF
jgi:hypothetical protein